MDIGKFVDTSFDSKFNKISNLHWLPFVGKQYDSTPKGKRLLIVGESHYNADVGEPGMQDFYMRKDWTREFILKEGLNQSPWFPGKASNSLVGNLERSLLNKRKAADEEKSIIWNSVAYMNVIQELLNNLKSRPTHDMKVIGSDVFFEVLRILKPDFCLFGGIGIAGYVSNPPHVMSKTGFETEGLKKMEKISTTYPRIMTLKRPKEEELKFVFVRHPSQYYSWSKWAPFVQAQLKGSIIIS